MISAIERNGIKNQVLDAIVTDIIDSYIATKKYSIVDNDGKTLLLEDIDSLNKHDFQLTYKDVLAIQIIIQEVTLVANLEVLNLIKGNDPVQYYDINGTDSDKEVLKLHLVNPSKFVDLTCGFNLTDDELRPLFVEIIDELIYEITNVKKEVFIADLESFQKREPLIDFIVSVQDRLATEKHGKLSAKYRSLSKILARLQTEPYHGNLSEDIQETGLAVMKHRSDPYSLRGIFSRLFIHPTSYSDFIKIFGEVKKEEPQAQSTLA